MFERIDKESDGEVYVKEVTDFLRVLDDNLEQNEKVWMSNYIDNILNSRSMNFSGIIEKKGTKSLIFKSLKYEHYKKN